MPAAGARRVLLEPEHAGETARGFMSYLGGFPANDDPVGVNR